MTVLLSALLSVLLWVSYLAVVYVYGAAADVDIAEALIAGQLYLALACVGLVQVAYTSEARRWWQWFLWPALALTIGVIPIVWLPWKIVNRLRPGSVQTPPL